jgi:hypothetical protein
MAVEATRAGTWGRGVGGYDAGGFERSPSNNLDMKETGIGSGEERCRSGGRGRSGGVVLSSSLWPIGSCSAALHPAPSCSAAVSAKSPHLRRAHQQSMAACRGGCLCLPYRPTCMGPESVGPETRPSIRRYRSESSYPPPAQGVSRHVCSSSHEILLHNILHSGVTEATDEAYAQQRRSLPHHRGVNRANLSRSYGATGKRQGAAAKRPPSRHTLCVRPSLGFA